MIGMRIEKLQVGDQATKKKQVKLGAGGERTEAMIFRGGGCDPWGFHCQSVMDVA